MAEIEKRFWTKRKLVAIVLILIVIGTVIMAVFYIAQKNPRILRQLLHYYPELRVSLYESGGEWKRDAKTDLPIFETTIKYAVYNHGEAEASNVTINIFLDGSPYLSRSLPVLTPYETYNDEFLFTIIYDSSRAVGIEAFCADSSDSDSLTLNATLPRWPQLDAVRKLYVTPYDQFVVDTLHYILESKFFLVPNFIHIRDWVADHIEYRYDSEVYGTEFWQLPRETLLRGTGDCEDFAILLCSLLRAVGYSEERVYVVLGEKDGQYHGWVKLEVDIIGWQNIEPQADAWNTFIGDFLMLSGYKAKYNFNDVQYIYVS